ncbi:MAG: sulfotransferase domain-containing protein [Candidatus Thorarchaeota archaeon]
MEIDFLVIGAQKAGSTLIHKFLLDHPAVSTPDQEIPYFEDPNYNPDQIMATLLKLFQKASKNKIKGIKRPDYLARPECPSRIARHLPNAKLIVTIRNPIDRAISAYFHHMRNGFIPIRPLDEGIQNIKNGVYIKRYPRSQEIIEYGFYHKHLSRYLEFFSPNQILVTQLVNFKSNPHESVKQLYDFLEVDSSFIPKSLENRQNPGVYDLRRLKIISLINRLTYRYHSGMAWRELRPDIISRIISKSHFMLDAAILSRMTNIRKPPKSKWAEKILEQIYEEDITRLRALLDIEFGIELHGFPS